MCNNDDKSSHQNSKRKVLLQNIYQMLEPLYHKRNPLITTGVDGSIF